LGDGRDKFFFFQAIVKSKIIKAYEIMSMNVLIVMFRDANGIFADRSAIKRIYDSGT
jgi:hypothetical protein